MMQQSDPFADVRINRKQENSLRPESAEKSQQLQQQDPFSEVRIKQAEGFPGIREVGRHAARIGSRIAETVGGIPGDISSLLQSGVFAGLEKFSGRKIPQESREQAKRERLPTSHELKELSQSATKGFTTPQGPAEKSIDEFAETVTGLLGPVKFRKALGIGLGATVAKKGLETLGVGESGQEAGKLGTMFLLSTLNPKGAMKYASSQYDKANALSRGASINAHHFQDNLQNMVNDLTKGVKTPSKLAVIRPAKKLISKVKKGKIPVHDLTAAKRDINTLIGDPTLLKREKILLKSLGKEVDTALKPYERINPTFSKAYRPANEIYGAIMQGNKASNFMRSVLGTKSILGATLAEAALGHPEYIIPTATAATAALGSARTVDFFTRLAKSKELRKFYGKALISAAKEDAPALRLYSDKIEQLMEED
jgi:hypothetical protein